MEKELIDNDLMAINTPAQAEKYYLPFFVSGKMDLSAIKKELRSIHHFSEEDIKITSRVLSNAHVRQTAINSSKASGYFLLLMGITILGVGIFLILFLLKKGFIAWLPIIVVGAGLVMIIQSIRTIFPPR